MSFNASGSIGDQLIYQRAGDKATVRKYFTPAQPRPPAIVTRRDKWRTIAAAWQALSPDTKKQWAENAKGQNITGYNLYLKTQLLAAPGATTWDAGATTWDAGATTWDT